VKNSTRVRGVSPLTRTERSAKLHDLCRIRDGPRSRRFGVLIAAVWASEPFPVDGTGGKAYDEHEKISEVEQETGKRQETGKEADTNCYLLQILTRG
jgi:hypothetical protein